MSTHHPITTASLAAALAASVLTAPANAELEPDPALWTVATNPSGDRPVPVVQYDPATGIMTVKTQGVNLADDTGVVGTMIGGDDVGMISLIVEGPEATTILLTGGQGTGGAGTDWSGQFFDGKMQIFGGPGIVDAYLLPIGATTVFEYPPGLTPADFGDVEMGLNFANFGPGDTIFGSVQFVGGPACCLPDLSCAQMPIADCVAAGGIPREGLCADAGCDMAGGCCLGPAGCVYTFPEDCLIPSGIFLGAGTTCDAGVCDDLRGCGLFADDVVYETDSTPGAVAMGDLDGDGDLDLAVANVNGNNVSVFLNNGDGTFAADVTYALPGNPSSIAIGDLDGDLDLDLAVGNVSNVSVLLNNGDGTFAAEIKYPAGLFPLSVVIGDLDGDLDLDLAAADSASNTVLVLLNNGDGTFGAAAPHDVGSHPTSAAIGDLDGDLDLDLAVVNSELNANDMSVLLNDGDGTFAPEVRYPTSFGPQSIAIGDLDGDSDLDLATADGAVVTLHLNNGDGTFALGAVVNPSEAPRTVAIGDLDGDLDLDLAVGTHFSKVVVHLNDGSGAFGPPVLNGVVSLTDSVAIGDLDGDLDLDIAATNRISPVVSVLLQVCPQACCLPTGTCDLMFVDDCTAAGGIPRDGLCADAGCDMAGACCLGPAGCVFTFEIDCLIPSGIFLGAGTDCTTGPNVCSDLPGCGVFPREDLYDVGTDLDFVALGDLYGNQRLDIVVTRPFDGHLNLLLNLGDGTFADGGFYDVGGDFPNNVAIGDLDGDHDLDFVVSLEFAGVSVLLNNGSGAFTNTGIFAAGTNVTFVALGDLDGDLDLDIAVTNRTSADVSVLLNNGDGTFVVDDSYGAGGTPISVAIADLDGINGPDIVVANSDDNNVSVLLNNGDGTFADDVLYGVGMFPLSMAIGDLDGDLDLDLAVANFSVSGGVSVLMNNGDGTFMDDVIVGSGSARSSVTIGDLNGDGELDLSVTGGGDVSVFLNNGDGTFMDEVPYDAGASSRWSAIGDLDDDLDLDLVLPRFDSFNGGVSVLLQACVEVSIADASAPETTDELGFTIQLSEPVGVDVTFDVSTADGTATTADNDYDALPGGSTVTIVAGDTESPPFFVNFNDDMKVELDETFTVHLANASPPNTVILPPGTMATGTIENDDRATIAITDVTQAEETSPFAFMVSLTQPVDVEVSMTVNTAPGTATGGGTDYANIVAGTVTFPANTTTAQLVAVAVTDENIVELDETFFVDLTALVNGGRNVTFDDDQGLGTIENTDSATIAVGSVSQFEEMTVFQVPITITAPVDVDVTVDFSTSPGSALGGGVDYFDIVNEEVTFSANTTDTQFVEVTVFDDDIVEPTEEFGALLDELDAMGRSVFLSTSNSAGVILNDPTVDNATISIGDVTDVEENSPFNFKVSLSNPVAALITVDVDTASGSATGGGVDYQSIGLLVLDIPANSVTETVPVTIVDENLVETDEDFFVNLSNIQAGGLPVTLADAQGRGLIENDDQAIITIDDVTDDEGDTGTTKFDFMVSMSNDVDVPVTMSYSTRASSATVADNDYSQGLGMVTFPAAPIPADQMVRVFVQGDTKHEEDEQFFVDLHALDAMGRDVIFGDPEGRGRILNDDTLINGACCFENGVCADLIPLDCVTAGGVFQGTTTYCYQIACPLPPTGACCFFNGECFVSSEFDCNANGGFYQGDATACGPGLCVAGSTENRASGTDKGSLLFIHAVEIRWSCLVGNDLIQDTFISMTNDYPEDVQVQMYFINGDPPADPVLDPNSGAVTERAHTGWNWVDNEITLTGNEATYWSAYTGLPKGVSPFEVLDPGDPPGRPALEDPTERVLRGYIIAWAVNNEGQEIRWNHLSAAATIVNYDDTTAWEYGATSFAVVDGAAGHGDPTGTPGELHIDGSEYTASYAELLMNFQAAESGGFSGPDGSGLAVISDTDLTVHPVSADLRQSNDGPVTTKASFNVWNENETKFSGMHRCVTCWDQELISDYDTPNHFLRMFLQTDHGKTRIDGVRATECDVAAGGVFSREASILGVHVRQLVIDGGVVQGGESAAAGGNLHGLGFEPALIQYDTITDPPGEATEGEDDRPSLPLDPTKEEIEEFLGDFVESIGR